MPHTQELMALASSGIFSQHHPHHPLTGRTDRRLRGAWPERMVDPSDEFDVIIIGTGAGGGTLARSLAPSGKRILLVERGGVIPREEDNWSPEAVFVRRRYRPDETWLDDDGVERPCPTHYCVGGNTKFYGAALTRFRAADFGRLRHESGVSPAWPLGYDDMEPFYTRAEQLYEVHGARGLDPTEPPATRPYPHPAVPHEARVQRLADDLAREGLHPFPLPLGILLDGRTGTSRASRHGQTAPPALGRCIRCGTCGGYPCRVHGKADAEIIGVRPALEHPTVTLLTEATAVRLETSASGREVTGVQIDRDGIRRTCRANIVVVACGAINSAALLLRSASDKHPTGLANGSGVVGRFYMRHLTSSLIGLSREANATVFQKTLGLNDFYLRGERCDQPLGHVQTLGRSNASMLKAAGVPVRAGMTLDELAERALELAVFTEDLPDSANRVTVQRDGRIRVRYQPNNVRQHDRLYHMLVQMLPRLGCDGRVDSRAVYVGHRGGIDNANHQCGTVRFGDDPKTSALDVLCRAHELDNLYVVDASFFVSSTAMNPALTVIANALRVGDHLLERL
jgi:choline dehydrogenase-like flavoprotein